MTPTSKDIDYIASLMAPDVRNVIYSIIRRWEAIRPQPEPPEETKPTPEELERRELEEWVSGNLILNKSEAKLAWDVWQAARKNFRAAQ